MASSSAVKKEEATYIKPDPAIAPTSSLMDEDEFEDTGELVIPGSAEDNGAWLAKLPKWLWEAWSTIAEDEEIELGKVRVYRQQPGGPEAKLKIVLHDIPGHAKVPKKYDVNMNKDKYSNTIAFSEKNQPGFRAGVSGLNRKSLMGQRERDYKKDPYKVSKKPYRSSIPKQTALAGFLKHEVTVTAVENDEYRRLTDARFTEMFQPKKTTTFTTGVDHTMHPGVDASGRFASFVATSKTKSGKKKQQEKAVRISQEELLDALHSCFKQFRYWSLRALKQRLKQPEAYIKSVVEKIATLIRAGPFAMQYKLNPEYENSLDVDTSQVKEQAAEEEVETDDDDLKDEDLDDMDEDFEDVRMDEG